MPEKEPGWIKKILAPHRIAKIQDLIGYPIGERLGCGHFGCVYQLKEPWVLKITRDPTEGAVWDKIQKYLDEGGYGASGLVRIKKIIRLYPDISWRGKTWPVHLIVREGVVPFMGEHYIPGLGFGVSSFTESRLRGIRKEAEANELSAVVRGLVLYREAATEWHKAAALKREYNRRSRQEAAETKMMDAINELYGPSGCPLGETLAGLGDAGIYLKDVHLGNIGWRVHPEIDGDELHAGLVIFDPGHTPTEGETAIPEFTIENPNRI